MTVKQRIGRILIPALPVNRRTFNILRFEFSAYVTHMAAKVSPGVRRAQRALAGRSELKVNIGSGGMGHDGWINVDVMSHHVDQSFPCDIRRGLPFRDGQVAMVFAEHVIEHIEFSQDLPRVLREIYRVLKPGGVVRIIVPDGERWVQAYASGDSDQWSELGFPKLPNGMPTYMVLLNHVFHQGGEHQFAYDFETMAHVLRVAGFKSASKMDFGKSRLEELCLDQVHHAPYSLYVEAVKS